MKSDPAAPVARVRKPAFGTGLIASKPKKTLGTDMFTNVVSFVLHVVLLGALVQSTVGNAVVTEEDEVTVMELTQELEAPPPPPPPPVDAPPPAQMESLEFTVPDVIPAEIPPPGQMAITAENIYQDMLAAAQDTTDNDAGAGVVAIGETPSFTPFTVAPNLRNRDEVGRALEREYPALLRDAGVGGRVLVWIRLDDQGNVELTQVNQSSGQPSLDEAALRVARVMEFSPAMNRDKQVPVWVSIPIQFQVR
jgi:protein TonB